MQLIDSINHSMLFVKTIYKTIISMKWQIWACACWNPSTDMFVWFRLLCDPEVLFISANDTRHFLEVTIAIQNGGILSESGNFLEDIFQNPKFPIAYWLRLCAWYELTYMYTLLGAGSWVKPSRDQQINVKNWQFYHWNLTLFFTLILSLFWPRKGGKIANKSAIWGTLEKWRTFMVTNICSEWRCRGLKSLFQILLIIFMS